MLVEAEIGAERKADEPVGGEVADHRGAGVAGTAKGAGGDGLDAVEKLEGGSGHEKDSGGVDDSFVGGVEAGDVARENEESDAHGGHEGSAENDGGVASIARASGVATSEGLADTDGGGRGEAKGHHVGESDGVERDLVAGLNDGAETRDERGYQSENGDFRSLLNGCGDTESDEFADAIEIGLQGCVEEFGFVAAVVPKQINDQDESEVAAGNAGGDAGAGDTVSWEAQFAVDEDPVAREIDEIGGDERESDGAHHVHSLERAANGEIEEEGNESGGEGAHIGGGEDCDGVGDAEAFEIAGQDPDGNGEKRGDREAEIDSVDERGVAIFATAGTERLRDKGVQADEKAFPEEGENDKEARGDGYSPDGFGGIGKAADHHGVHDGHGHPADFGEDEGKSEAQGGAKLRTEDGEEGHGELTYEDNMGKAVVSGEWLVASNRKF